MSNVHVISESLYREQSRRFRSFDDPNPPTFITEDLDLVAKTCKRMGVDHSEMIERVKRKIRANPEDSLVQALIDEVKHAVLDRFKSRACFIMTPEETKLHNNSVPFTARASLAFPESEEELGHAGNCLAFGESNACVYHSMIALESPLAAQARYFGAKSAGKTWGNIIDNIQKKLDQIAHDPKLSRLARGKDALVFHSEAAKEFRYFKDAWRNHIMHERKYYDVNSARAVYDHVVAFINHLSEQFSGRTNKRFRWR